MVTFSRYVSRLYRYTIKDYQTAGYAYCIDKKVIDITDARFLPVPDDVDSNLIRTNGTSVGKKKSGHFKNTKTENRYIFYLTGNGERVYFEIADKKYLIDNVVDANNE